jgi:hypothetical protein
MYNHLYNNFIQKELVDNIAQLYVHYLKSWPATYITADTMMPLRNNVPK